VHATTLVSTAQEEDQAQYEQPSSWEDFWRRTTAQHDEAMRNAGKDPYKYVPPPTLALA
jgi:hypothetical protein